MHALLIEAHRVSVYCQAQALVRQAPALHPALVLPDQAWHPAWARPDQVLQARVGLAKVPTVAAPRIGLVLDNTSASC